ncbi:MAG: nucleoside hydrolase [Flavitalea sp.]
MTTKPIALICLFILTNMIVTGQSRGGSTSIPRIIFDTDMGPDYDDVGAIAILHAFADSGDIKLLATIASTKYPGVAATLSVLNTYFGRPKLPIGVPRGNAVEIRDWQGWSDSLQKNYPHNITSNDNAEDATGLYRKLLASAEDRSITIVTVGFFTNLSELLQSKPDQYSALDGKQLVATKVKSLVSMAGIFPVGKEFNIEKDVKAAQFVCNNWPGSILFSGFEIGKEIRTGLPLTRRDDITNSPVKDVFSICIPKSKDDLQGRMSWDQTAVLIASKPSSPFFDLTKGHIQVKDDGSNTWTDGDGSHNYVRFRSSPLIVQEYLEHLMSHQPKKRK